MKTGIHLFFLVGFNDGISYRTVQVSAYNLAYNGIISSEAANDLSLSSIPKGEKEKAYLFFNKESYSCYCKEYREYWDWVALRNENRYQGNMEHGKGYDAKNMMHTIRFFIDNNSSRLGRSTCSLPEFPDREKGETVLVSMREELYR